VRFIFKQTRSEKLHLGEDPRQLPAIYQEEQAQSAESALLGPMSSDWCETLTHALVAEPYSPDQVRTGALQAVLYAESHVPRAAGHAAGAACPGADRWRGRQTHAHGYWRSTTCIGDELGGLSTSLGLSASPPLILSTESVVVMEWKGMSTSIATQYRIHIQGKMQGASAKPALFGPMSSDWGATLTHTLVAEPQSSDQVQTGALQVELYSRNRMPRAGRLARAGGKLDVTKAVRRIGTTTRGYLQLWAMNWEGWAPR